jgi:hypothetical protein
VVDEPYDDANAGDGLLNLSFAGTGAIVGTGIAGAVLPDTFKLVHAGLAGLLFVIGTGALLWGYALGVSRSRTLTISMAGLFFLAEGAAPPKVRRAFLVALAVQSVAGVTAALVRPTTELAFGVLAPIFGLGLMALWGGRYGSFPAKAPESR